MSTSARIKFEDETTTVVVHQHSDGYLSVIQAYCEKAKKFAWSFPRFDPADFAAAYIAANKPHGGGHLYVESEGENWDSDRVYVVTLDRGQINITEDT